ncbi:MAG: glycerol-3-phosphate responsive antiterminator [Lachnospiraceae bacterium]|nr:glycerol-3-phosphate responsive antiterminator [Lachnospiraceae bacterium]
MRVVDLLESSPVIAAIKDENGLEKCLQTDCDVIFILFGNIINIADIVDKVKASGKTAIVHVDLIQGLSSKEIVIDFIKKHTKADGIISTKPPLVHYAIKLGLIGVQRTFVIDSMAVDNTKKQIDSFRPDAIEVMPGIIPKVIKEFREYANIPIIAGGLLSDKKDVMAAFEAGADAISTTNQKMWYV